MQLVNYMLNTKPQIDIVDRGSDQLIRSPRHNKLIFRSAQFSKRESAGAPCGLPWRQNTFALLILGINDLIAKGTGSVMASPADRYIESSNASIV